jgi:Ca-activated chloride channel family protein
VHAAVTARTKRPQQSDGLDVAVLNDAGQECASGGQVTLADYEGNPVINASVIFAPDESDSFGCDAEDALYLEVRRGDEIQDRAPDNGQLPIELVVTVEPEVTNLSALPAQVATEQIDDRLLPAGPSAGNVVGGVSFSSAPQLEPGTWSDTQQTGEMLFYRVPVDWGQAVRFRFQVRADPALEGRVDFTPVTLFAYSPDRTPISLTDSDLGYTGSYLGNQDVTVAASLPEVRYRNREHYSFGTSRVGPTSLAGDYYFAVHLRDEPGDRRFQVQTEVSADVTGESAGAPAYAEEVAPEPTAEAAPTAPTPPPASDRNDEAPLPVARVAVVGGSGLMIAGALVVAVAVRRRSGPRS